MKGPLYSTIQPKLLVYQVLSAQPYSQTWSCTVRVPGPIYTTIQPNLVVYCSCTRSYLLNHTDKPGRVLFVYQHDQVWLYGCVDRTWYTNSGPLYSTIQPKLVVHQVLFTQPYSQNCSCTRSYLLNHTAKLVVYQVLSTQPYGQNWSCTMSSLLNNTAKTGRAPGPLYSTIQPNLLVYQVLSTQPYSQNWSCTRSYQHNHTAKPGRVLLVYQVLATDPYIQKTRVPAH